MWAMVFAAGSPFLVYDGLRLKCAGFLVEGSRVLPDTLHRRSASAAVGVGVSDTSVFVLAVGGTDYRFELLDEYATGDCTYRRTLRLPDKHESMAYDGEVFFLCHEEPASTILALRPIW